MVNVRREWACRAGLLLAGVLAYANSLPGDFLFDDRPGIVGNVRLRRLWPLDGLLADSARPAVDLSFALNYAAGQLHSWGYHLVNGLIHLAAALTLYGLVRRTLLTDTLRARYGTAATPLAFTISLLWMLHPLQTQSVTYIVQRAEALMGLCVFLTLYAVSRAASEPGARRWTILAAASCILGVLSKPVMVIAPLLALAYDRTFFSGSVRETLRARGHLYAALSSTWILAGGILWSAMRASALQGDEPTAGFHLQTLTSMEYAAAQPGVIWHYVRLALWPHPLVIDYHWPAPTSWTAVAIPAAPLGALLAAAGWAFLRRSPAGFLGVWIAATLAPTSSVIPIADLIFEHRMYLPLAGLIGLAVFGGWAALRRVLPDPSARRRLAATLVTGVAVAYAAVTIQRNQDYRSEAGMWADVAAKQPDNARAHINLANLLGRAGRYEEAIAHAQAALRLRPDDVDAYNNLGSIYDAMHRLPDAAAAYRRAIQAWPNDPRAYRGLGRVAAQLRQPDEAIANFQSAIRLEPRFVAARIDLADQLVRQGRYGEAIAQYEASIQLNPYYAASLYGNYGIALTHAGRLADAADQYRKALQLDPNQAASHSNLGAVLIQQGHPEEAAHHLAEALRLNPALAEATTNLNALLADHPELRRLVQRAP